MTNDNLSIELLGYLNPTAVSLPEEGEGEADMHPAVLPFSHHFTGGKLYERFLCIALWIKDTNPTKKRKMYKLMDQTIDSIGGSEDALLTADRRADLEVEIASQILSGGELLRAYSIHAYIHIHAETHIHSYSRFHTTSLKTKLHHSGPRRR